MKRAFCDICDAPAMGNSFQGLDMAGLRGGYRLSVVFCKKQEADHMKYLQGPIPPPEKADICKSCMAKRLRLLADQFDGGDQ